MDNFITSQERRIYRAEIRVIRMQLRSPRSLTRLATRIKPHNFTDYRHQLIWAAMLRLNERGEPISPESILAELASQSQDDDAGGSGYLKFLARKMTAPDHRLTGSNNEG